MGPKKLTPRSTTMFDHHNLSLVSLRQIIKQSTTAFMSNILTFLFLSMILFSFKHTCKTLTLFFTTFLDEYLSWKPLLYTPDYSIQNNVDQIFFGNANVGRVSGVWEGTDGVKLSHEIVVFGFKLFFVNNGWDSEKDDVLFIARLIFMTTLFTTCLVIIGFLYVQSCIHGVVFLTVVNEHLGSYSFIRRVQSGWKLGFQRVFQALFMRFIVRFVLNILIGLLVFNKPQGKFACLKLFSHLIQMPFSNASPSVQGLSMEASVFMLMWFFLDTLVNFASVLYCWVLVMDDKTASARDVMKFMEKGLYLISTMPVVAIKFQFCEAILCGSFARWGISLVFGKCFASFFESMTEVYFMVVWLKYYFAARCKDADLKNTKFGGVYRWSRHYIYEN